MNLKERSIIFFTFLVTCLALGLLAGGMGTQYWVVSRAERPANNKSEGFVHFGLFAGTRRMNTGYGERVNHMDIIDIMFRDKQFVLRGLFVSTIASVSVSIFFGILTALLAVVNTASNPTELICHLPGLITLNTLAAIGSFAAVVTWIIQFFLKLRFNVLIREDRIELGWTSVGLANIGHSFWLVAIALGLYCLNVTILYLLEQKRRSRIRAMTQHYDPSMIGAGPMGMGPMGVGMPQNIYGSSGSILGGGNGTLKKNIPESNLSNGNLMLY